MTKDKTAIKSNGPAPQPEHARTRVHVKRDVPDHGTPAPDFARMFKVSTSWVYAAIARKEIPSIRLPGGVLRIPTKYVTDLLREADESNRV